MKEFREYLRGIPNGDGTEKEIKNYLEQMDCFLEFFGRGKIYWCHERNVSVYFALP